MIRHLTSVQHPLVKHLVKVRQNRDYRYDHQSLILEGITLVSELGGGTRFKTIAVKDEMLIPLGIEADEVIIVNEQVMNKISGLEHSEGIVAEIAMPKPASMQGKKFILALDGVNDPGNLGNLLRSALAFGWEGAFVLQDSCDPFNEKAIRAARGATFRLPLAWGSWSDLKQIVSANQLTPLVADLEGKELGQLNSFEKVLLVVGNEARGVSATAKELCDPITIEMLGDMESLNVAVAGSIMMYGLRPRRKG